MPIPEMFQIVGAATAAGWTAGAGVELWVQHTRARELQAYSEEAGKSVSEEDSPSRLHRLGSAILGPMAIVSGVAAGLTAGTWVSHESTSPKPPHLEIVADFSRATALEEDGKPSDQVNAIMSAFSGDDELSTKAVIAISSTVREVEAETVSTITPWGHAPLEQATRTALDNSRELREKAFAEASRRSIGVLILSNDNTVGDTAAIVAEAKSEGLPVYAVNISSTATAGANELKIIAEQAKGKYWSNENADPDKIHDAIKSTLKSRHERIEDNPNWPLRMLAVALTAYLPWLYKWRRQMLPINKGIEDRS